MAVTHDPAGFTGTVDQIDEARRFALGGGGRFRVASSTDWIPTASGSVNRTVNIAAGAGMACGVYDFTTTSDSVAFAANGGGTDRFDVVVATFDWSALTVSFRVVQGTTVPPVIVRTGATVDATKVNWLPGLRYDAVIATIRVRPSVTLLAPADLYDCRPWGDWQRLNVVSATYRAMIDVDPNGRIREVGSGNARTDYVRQNDLSWTTVSPNLLYSLDNGAASGGVVPGATGAGTINAIGPVPAHTPGPLRVKASGIWNTTGTVGAFLYLGWSNTTSGPITIAGSRIRTHNHGSTAPLSFMLDGYFDSDGAAKYLWILTDSDVGSNANLVIQEHSWAVWAV